MVFWPERCFGSPDRQIYELATHAHGMTPDISVAIPEIYLVISDNAPTLMSEKPFPERWREWFTVIGSIAGIAALLWNVYWTTSNAPGKLRAACPGD